jgi:hypothetical protein
VDEWSPGTEARRTWEATATEPQVSFGSDGSVLNQIMRARVLA